MPGTRTAQSKIGARAGSSRRNSAPLNSSSSMPNCRRQQPEAFLRIPERALRLIHVKRARATQQVCAARSIARSNKADCKSRSSRARLLAMRSTVSGCHLKKTGKPGKVLQKVKTPDGHWTIPDEQVLRKIRQRRHSPERNAAADRYHAPIPGRTAFAHARPLDQGDNVPAALKRPSATQVPIMPAPTTMTRLRTSGTDTAHVFTCSTQNAQETHAIMGGCDPSFTNEFRRCRIIRPNAECRAATP